MFTEQVVLMKQADYEALQARLDSIERMLANVVPNATPARTEILSREQAAVLLGFSLTKFDRMVRAGLIPYTVPNPNTPSKRMFLQSEIMKHLTSKPGRGVGALLPDAPLHKHSR